MRIVQLELTSKGAHIGATPIREQAVAAAKAYAARKNAEVSVVAHLDNGKTREIVVKPDGKVDKLWARSPLEPIQGAIYRNRNGSDFKCIRPIPGEYSAEMERLVDGYTLVAHGIQRYIDGTIEWDYSTGGQWPEGGPRNLRH